MKWWKRLWRAIFGPSTQEWIDDYVRYFPGRCPVCGYYRFGLQEGFRPKPPAPHYCPEREAKCAAASEESCPSSR